MHRRHGRPLRVTDGPWSGSAVGVERVRRLADDAARRLRRSWPPSERPDFTVDVMAMPASSPAQASQASPSVADSTTKSGRIHITLYAWPLALRDDEPLERLVDQTVAETLAEALGLEPDEL